MTVKDTKDAQENLTLASLTILRSRPNLTSVSDASQKRGSPQRFCEASLNLELILG
jgi:hypothetical protein